MKKNLIFLLLACSICSCQKENTVEKTRIEGSYVFIRSEFVGDIECYDSIGAKIDVPPQFIKNNFLFSDGGAYPYKTIDIHADSSVSYIYYKQELGDTVNGFYTSDEDSLHFFSNYAMVIFSGFIKNDILYIPAYGYTFWNDNCYNCVYLGGTYFGLPDIKKIYSPFGGINKMFIQKFNLTYLKSEL